MIVASKSPRRKEILSGFGFNVEIKSENVEEVSDKDGIANKIVDIARKKAMAVAIKNPEKYVLGADTVVVIDDEIMGKPTNEKEAALMLQTLSGRWHIVITAYSFVNINKKFEINDYQETRVFFRELSTKDIEWYVNTKDPMDKAGAYGIQGQGTFLVEKIEGDFYNVMGFPLSKFIDDLKLKGLEIEDILKL